MAPKGHAFLFGENDMTSTVADIIGVMEKVAPSGLAETWDNPGLQVGSIDWPVKRVMVALDPSLEVLENAVKESADMLITHHPLIFKPIKSVDVGTSVGHIIELAIRNRLSIFSAHTNLDSAADGLNDILVSHIGLENVSVLDVNKSMTSSATEEANGLGRIGDLPFKTDLASLCRYLKQALHLESIRMIGAPEFPVSRVAVCCGSGSSLLDRFFASGAQVFITGDVRYHDARSTEEKELALIDIGHFNSEHLVVKSLSSRLTRLLQTLNPDISVHACDVERDPFIVL